MFYEAPQILCECGWFPQTQVDTELMELTIWCQKPECTNKDYRFVYKLKPLSLERLYSSEKIANESKAES